MTLSAQYLLAVSTAIVFGFNTKTTATYYYYTSSGYSSTQTPVSTVLPDGIVAVLKNGNSIVATVPSTNTAVKTKTGTAPNGYPASGTIDILFVDTSPSSYTFNVIEIYTTLKGSLYTLIATYSVSPTTKTSDEVLNIEFTLNVNDAPSIYVLYAFIYLVVPGFALDNPLPVSPYPGIILYLPSGVSGSVSYVSFVFTGNGFAILLTLTTTGGGTATINAYTAPPSTSTPSGLAQSLVFSASLPVELPKTSTPYTYPIEIGIEYGGA